MRLEQQCANLARRFNALKLQGLRHHFDFVFCAQVCHDPASNVHAFANVKRQRASTFEDVDP